MQNPTAVIYARVSSSGSLEYRQSTDRPVADLTQYAQSMQYNILKTFEEHISGTKKNSEREVFTNCLDYCKSNKVDCLLVSELSRLGRNAFQILATVQELMDASVNIYLQKERFTLLDDDGKPSIFAPIMLAVLGTCAQLERENIMYRLNSGRAQYINKGGKLGRRVGYRKSVEKKKEEYADVIRLLNKGTYTLQQIAKLTDVSIRTVQRVKKEFCS